MKQTVRKLSKKIKKLSKRMVSSKGVVLMYHRISDNCLDPWKLNVSESNFQDHLELYSRNYNVLPLNEFNGLRKIGRLPERSLVITFDDGYADNVLSAAPMMLEAAIPATFFVCTGTLGSKSGMWWDTLAQIVFGGRTLIDSEKIEYEKVLRSSFINKKTNNRGASDDLFEDVTQISLEDLYMKMWKTILPLSTDMQKTQLKLYGRQLGFELANTYPMMQDSDVRNLSEYDLFEIGAHTKNHVQLSAHNIEIQEMEIHENIKYLNELTGLRVQSMSYPFGSYNNNTLAVMKQVEFDVACTTLPEVTTRSDDSLLLPRITVYDVSAETLQSDIDRYFK